jgi:hypothetical protein
MGNSLFVDDNMQPYPNQWQLLASVCRIAADQVDWIVNDAARRGQVLGVRASVAEGFEEAEPWALPPSRKRVETIPEGACPESLELVLGNSVPFLRGAHTLARIHPRVHWRVSLIAV